MMRFLHTLSHPLFMRMEPEEAHTLAIKGLKVVAMTTCSKPRTSPLLRTELCGLSFAHPLGMAAGFDKNGEAIEGLFSIGMSHVECGTTTPKPQGGNPKPRLFRLMRDEAVINRMGFNNEGHEAMVQRIKAVKKRAGIVGVNIGANKDSIDRIDDYVVGMRHFAPLADYVTINISSPNTPGLRDLQEAEAVQNLLAQSLKARDEAAMATGRRTPVWLKIAPDLDEASLNALLDAALAHTVDALIISNTTIARPISLKEQATAQETGGLSGAPLFASSTAMLAKAYLKVGEKIPLIGVGGIHSAQTAWEKLEAGASLLQLYSAMVFKGAGLIEEILTGLEERAKAEAITSVHQVRGRRAAEISQWV
jgi:dihydroorotate dehydrogenase